MALLPKRPLNPHTVVSLCFQAVGHGTFLTGNALNPKGEHFTWVYDCGSKRPTRIKAAIEGYREGSPQQIDIFVLSHFDDDHVNGVEQFLKHHTVRCLVLPYLDLAQQLAQLASVAASPCSASTAVFQVNPQQWLSQRGLADRVESVLFVRGGPDTDDVRDPSPFPFLPDGALPSELNKVDERFTQDYFTEQRAGGAPAPQPQVSLHTAPFVASAWGIEFMFFNSQQPELFRQNEAGERVAKRSGATIQTVQVEVQEILVRYRLTHESKAPRRRWREAFRKVYDRHFGYSGPARNNISLCLLIGPAQAKTVANGRVFRGGLLCQGDLCVNSGVIEAMKAHFGGLRWRSLGIVQVPHHGSQHSWSQGNARAFSPDCFVHCVPDVSDDHPHAEVNKDLAGYRVLRADYQAPMSGWYII